MFNLRHVSYFGGNLWCLFNLPTIRYHKRQSLWARGSSDEYTQHVIVFHILLHVVTSKVLFYFQAHYDLAINVALLWLNESENKTPLTKGKK